MTACKICKWFRRRSLECDSCDGDCRIRAPVRMQRMHNAEDAYPVDGWPRVRSDDLCGDFCRESGKCT
jgi:hypothetical protein